MDLQAKEHWKQPIGAKKTRERIFPPRASRRGRAMNSLMSDLGP